MGICLDTASHKTTEDTPNRRMKGFQSTRVGGHFDSEPGHLAPANKLQMAPAIIFVIGGPGTGKVTFSDGVAGACKAKLVHIDMDKALAEYANNFMTEAEGGSGGVSSRVAAEMTEARLRKAPAAHSCLVSGFPRSLDDLREYDKRVARKDGLIFLEYPTHVIKDLLMLEVKNGRMSSSRAESDLQNYITGCLPMVEFHSAGKLLHKVQLSGRDIGDNLVHVRAIIERILDRVVVGTSSDAETDTPMPSHISCRPTGAGAAATVFKPLILVMGGPGSNKSRLCHTAVSRFAGWTHISCSRLLRDLTTSPSDLVTLPTQQLTQAAEVSMLVETGQLVPQRVMWQCLLEAMQVSAQASTGFVISGYPRDEQQLAHLQQHVKTPCPLLLLDCSELELGRSLGRRATDPDDSVATCRQRLHVYRYTTLPFLRQLHSQRQLLLIDGDRDEQQILDDLCRCLYLEIHRATGRSPLTADKTGAGAATYSKTEADSSVGWRKHAGEEVAACNGNSSEPACAAAEAIIDKLNTEVLLAGKHVSSVDAPLSAGSD